MVSAETSSGPEWEVCAPGLETGEFLLPLRELELGHKIENRLMMSRSFEPGLCTAESLPSWMMESRPSTEMRKSATL